MPQSGAMTQLVPGKRQGIRESAWLFVSGDGAVQKKCFVTLHGEGTISLEILVFTPGETLSNDEFEEIRAVVAVQKPQSEVVSWPRDIRTRPKLAA